MLDSTSQENNVKQYEGKKINATVTQIQSYREFKASGKDKNERRYVLSVLRTIGVPSSRRYIQEITGLPINHLTRVLYDLRNSGDIVVSKIDVCQFTGKKVIHYSPKPDNDEDK